MDAIKIKVEVEVNATLEKAWKCWTNTEDILKWNTASADWHTTKAENDLKVGGIFNYRMEAKDGSFGFDFWGTYTKLISHETLEITLGDDRKIWVTFSNIEGKTKIVETFEAENENSIELQQAGWQAILDNFKKHVESV